MKHPLLRRILMVALLTLPACGLFTGKDDGKTGEKPHADDPKLVGRIASIPPDKRFVLIQSYGKWNVSTGTVLTTRGEDNRSANLLVTGESLGQFAAADLRSGTVEVGDAVYSRHVPKPEPTPESPSKPGLPTPTPPELPESQALPQP